MFSKRCENFSFDESDFVVHKAKESTARVVLWKEYQLINSFTLECSFCGPTKGQLRDKHFSIKDLLDIGKQFCLTLLDYTSMLRAPDSKIQMKKIIKEIE